MYANVLKFHILIPHEKIGDRIFFLSQLSPILELFPFDKITYLYCCYRHGQAVLESGSWGHSVLQTPALVFFVGLHDKRKHFTLFKGFIYDCLLKSKGGSIYYGTIF